MDNGFIEILSVYNPHAEFATCYHARTWGDIEGTVIDAINELGIDVSEETFKEMVHDLIMMRSYKFDEYTFELHYEDVYDTDWNDDNNTDEYDNNTGEYDNDTGEYDADWYDISLRSY